MIGEKLGGVLLLHPSGNLKIILALKEMFPSRLAKQKQAHNALQKGQSCPGTETPEVHTVSLSHCQPLWYICTQVLVSTSHNFYVLY